MGLEYCNPVHDGYFADPFVMRTDDGYVAIGTGRSVDGKVFEVLRSPDLVHWRSVGGALVPPSGLGTDFWAPEVAHADGRWWMYYSVGTGDAGHHLRVAVADDPVGPYRDLDVNLTPDERFAIDPHPFQDRDGVWWLYFARDVLEGERVGTMLAVRRLQGMSALTGPTIGVLEASADWQIYQRDGPCTATSTTGTRSRVPSSASTTGGTTSSTPAGRGWNRRTAWPMPSPTGPRARGSSPPAPSRCCAPSRTRWSGRGTTAS